MAVAERKQTNQSLHKKKLSAAFSSNVLDSKSVSKSYKHKKDSAQKLAVLRDETDSVTQKNIASASKSNKFQTMTARSQTVSKSTSHTLLTSDTKQKSGKPPTKKNSGLTKVSQPPKFAGKAAGKSKKPKGLKSVACVGLSKSNRHHDISNDSDNDVEMSDSEVASSDESMDVDLSPSPEAPRNKSKDKTWEKAVEKARSIPEGASDRTMEKGKESRKNKQNVADEKSKPMKVIKDAAKKMKMKDSEEGVKRKHDGDTKASESKKPKMEEMSYKDRKKARKMLSSTYELSSHAKGLWEELRRADLKPERRPEVCRLLYNIVKGHASTMIFAHDTSRVIQTLMKYSSNEHKNALFEELKEHIVTMMKSKYAKFFVRKLLKCGTKAQRECVFEAMTKNIVKLIKHKEAGAIVELAYNHYANVAQRTTMAAEFYGPTFTCYKTAEVKSLSGFVQLFPDKSESVLNFLKTSLSTLVEKSVLEYSFVHRLFLDFFNCANEKLRSEMIETLRDGVVRMLHTREGARVAMIGLWHGTAKDRKNIIKSFKTYVVKICKEEYGHLAALALFDVVDDTKLVQKAFLDEMLGSVANLARNQYGRKVLLYLLAPRDPLHFHPDIVGILLQGDKNQHSKKDAALRRHELLTYISRPLVNWVVSNCRELVVDTGLLLLMVSVIKHAKCDPSPAMRAVAEIAAEPFTAGSPEHIVEHPAGHLTLKRLILNDVERIKLNATVLFSSVLLDVIPSGELKSWATCNRGCFILVSLLELGQADVTKRVAKELAPIKSSLSKLNFKGAQILITKLAQ